MMFGVSNSNRAAKVYRALGRGMEEQLINSLELAAVLLALCRTNN